MTTNTIRSLAVAVALAAAVTLAPVDARADVTSGRTYDPVAARTAGPRPGMVVFGDSTTVHAERAYREAHYRGELNGVSGRDVSELTGLVNARTANARGRKSRARIKVAVIALGANGGAWTMSRPTLVANVLRLRAAGAKRIVLVTPWRDPAKWNADTEPWPGRRADVVARFAGWERQIAASLTRVCVADWAAYADANRWATNDGVHQGARAASIPERAYATVVLAKVRGRGTCT